MKISDCCVLIPSLSPDERLTNYAGQLLEAGFGALVVVDDGSAESYQPLFRELEGMDRCVVLHHEVNKGKGVALKTGMAYIRDHTAFKAVITADSDGQHRVEDTLNICSSLNGTERVMLLGSRDFSKESVDVPARSKAGNRITSAVFKALYGRYLPDTQTGLRAFVRELIPEFLTVSGDRFEYEMNQLIYCARNDIAMKPIPIRTVYIEENASSHFHPIRDSWRIYKLLLGNFLKFTSASILSWLVDIILFSLLKNWDVLGHIRLSSQVEIILLNGGVNSLQIFWATVLARICSATLNYQLNKSLVFQIKGSRGAVGRYIALCVLIMIISGAVVGALSALLPGINSTVIKMVVDFLLFFVNYRIQKAWVFPAKRADALKGETK